MKGLANETAALPIWASADKTFDVMVSIVTVWQYKVRGPPLMSLGKLLTSARMAI